MSTFSYYASGSPIHQYYTLALVNPPRDDATDEFPIVYNETRNSPFLQDPQSYYASIVRFSCSTPLLPVFIPQMKNPDLNETVYSITMHHPELNGGLPLRKRITFTSVNPFLSKQKREYYYIYQPVQWINMINQALAFCWEQLGAGSAIPFPSDDPPFIAWNGNTSIGTLFALENFCKTPYPQSQVGYPATYYPSTQSTVLSAVPSGPQAVGGPPGSFANLTITLAAGQGARYLIGDYVNLNSMGANSKQTPYPPVRIIDINGDLIVVEQRGFGVPYQVVSPLPIGANIRANTPINIYMNAALYTLFSSFAAENQATATVPNPPEGTHWKLQFAPTNDGTSFASQSSEGYQSEYDLPQYGDQTSPPVVNNKRIALVQQYSTVPIWSPVSSFVFITSVLPINPEAISIPSVLGNDKIINGGNNSAYGTVLTDFEVPLDSGYENKPVISYVPSAEYRLVDLNGNAPLNTIEISLGWRDKLGVFNPLNIGPNGFAQLKILFRKKDFNGV